MQSKIYHIAGILIIILLVAYPISATLFSIKKVPEEKNENIVYQGDNQNQTNGTNNTKNETKTYITATLKIDYGETKYEQTGSYHYIEVYENISVEENNATAFGFLLKASEIGNFSVGYEYYGEDVFVNEINGTANDYIRGWEYNVNGEYPSQASNHYQVKNGDVIEWIFGHRHLD